MCFEGRGHRSKFKVPGENVAKAVGATSSVFCTRRRDGHVTRACAAGDVGVRTVPRLAVREQAQRRQHGGDHGRGAPLLARALPRDPREGDPLRRQPDGPLPARAARVPHRLHGPHQTHRRQVLLHRRR